MKKLLTMLGAISLVATAGISVVACKNNGGGTTDPGPSDGKEAILKLINEFNNEVVNKFNINVQEPMARHATLLEEEASENGLIFFSKKHLKQVYEQNSVDPNEIVPVKFYEGLSGVEKDEFQANIQSLLSPTAAISNLREAISATKYSVLISALGNKWVDETIFDLQNAHMQFSETNESGDKFIANIELDYATGYKYLDAEEQITSKAIKGTIVITISDDGDIITAIKSIQTELAADLLKTGDANVWTDYQSLQKAESDLTYADLLSASTPVYKSAINKHNINFADKIPAIVKEKYFSKTGIAILDSIEIGYKNPEEVIKEDMSTTIDSLESLDMELKANRSIISGKDKWYLYFGQLDRKDFIDMDSTKIKGNEKVYQDLETVWKKPLQTYGDKFFEMYQEYTKNSQELENELVQGMVQLSVANQLVVLEGLQFSLPNGYKQNLSDLGFNWSVAFDNQANASVELNDITQSKIFASYYYATMQIVEEFHKFYGIQSSENISNKDWNKVSLFQMTGKTNILTENGKKFNIWDHWKSVNEKNEANNQLGKLISTESDAKKLSDMLSLEATSDARKIKEEHLISKIDGTTTFSLVYDEDVYMAKYPGTRMIAFEENSFINGIEWPPGLASRVSSNNHNHGAFSIQTDIIKIRIFDSTFDQYIGKGSTRVGGQTIINKVG